MEYQCLTNGFQVIYEKPPCSIPVTSIYVVCKISAIHEPNHLKGISHLIEHMSFKGTTRTPDTQKFLGQFNELGIEFNASTYFECVRFEVKCPDSHVEKCIKLLSESILLCDFSLKNFKKEEDVVAEENRRNDDDPEFIVSIANYELVFEDTQFQFPVDHSRYHKTKFDYKEVYDYYKKTYIPSNLFLSTTTNISFENILKYIKKTQFSKGVSHPPVSMKYIPQRDGFDYQIIEKKTFKTILLNVSFKTCNYYNEDRFVLNLLSNILGDGLNGRLVDVLRQKHGLVYYANAWTDYNYCGGTFTISTQCEPSSLMKKNGVLPLLIKELKKLKEGITQKELTIAKIKTKERDMFDLENSITLTTYNAWQLLYKPFSQIIPYSKIYETYIENITLADMNECIKKYFCFERMCLIVVGSNIPSTDSLLDDCCKL